MFRNVDQISNKKSIVKGIPLKVGAQKKNDFEQAQAFGGHILQAKHLLEHFKNIFWHALKKSDKP